jgi:adenosine deaminase
MLGEYALLMARAPLGLGLNESEVKIIAEMSLAARFGGRKA